MAADTARTTEKSYWGKSREDKTKQVKFKMLFKYSQRRGRGNVLQMRAPATGKAREPMEVSRTAGTIRL